MGCRRLVALAAVAVLSVAAARPASARLITYTVTLEASGSVAGKAFANRPVKLAFTSDTALVSPTPRPNGDTVAKVITAGSYVAGLGFGVAAIAKFKQHKDNPTQMDVGLGGGLATAATRLGLSGEALSSYRLGRELEPASVEASVALPLRVPVLTEAGRSTLVIDSIAAGSATFGAHFAE